jgi:hypothetical protein
MNFLKHLNGRGEALVKDGGHLSRGMSPITKLKKINHSDKKSLEYSNSSMKEESCQALASMHPSANETKKPPSVRTSNEI